ncbi:neuropeptide Y receptor type 6-like [Argopecten irradians]|uniref:neuropeptide Y receptor type 6-like n=1 Tax=Argopecten irradians TaxID=31199 RepID=UPI003723BABE
MTDDERHSAPEVFGVCLQILGFVENIYVIILLFSRPKLRKRAHEFFILCLSFSDLLVCFTSLTFYIPIYTNIDIYSETFCRWVYIGWVLFYCSSLILVLLISLERYNAVNFQNLSPFAGKSKYYATVIPTALLFIFIVVFIENVETTGDYYRCRLELMYSHHNMSLILICTQLIIILPLVILTTSFYGAAVHRLACLLRKQQCAYNERNRLLRIGNTMPSSSSYLRLKLMSNNLQPFSSKVDVGDQSKNSHMCKTARYDTNNVSLHSTTHVMKDQACKHSMHCSNKTKKLKKALTTVLIILITLFTTFVPHVIIQMLKLAHIFLPGLESITKLILIAHPVVNPMLYVWRIKSMRKELRN